MSIHEVSLLELLKFNAKNDTETNIMTNVEWNIVRDIFDKTNTKWAKGHYWLGGQIKMNVNDPISLEKTQQAKIIGDKRFIELGGPANSFEMASINTSRRELHLLEQVIDNYTQIMKYRVKNLLLHKTISDIANHILEYL